MPSKPVFPWFPGDWRSDPKVSRLSPAERGVYRELLDLAWMENPQGTIPKDPDELLWAIPGMARFASEFKLNLLRIVQLFWSPYPHDDSRLCNEKVLRLLHQQKSHKDRGRKGGQKTQEKIRKKKKSEDSSSSSFVADTKAYYPSLNPSLSNTELDPKDPKISSPPNGGGYTESFLLFWRLYPRKKRKDSAFRAWVSVVKKTAEADILAGLKKVLPEWENKDDEYIPHAATWLNGKGWEDEPDQRRGHKPKKYPDGYQAFLDVADSLRGEGGSG